MKWKPKYLEHGDNVSFKAIHKEYGVAEFIVCPLMKRGKITELRLYPAQQDNPKGIYYAIKCHKNVDSFSIKSWVGINTPDCWMNFWCKEHKTMETICSVPSNASWFYIHMGSSGVSVYFGDRVIK